VTVTSCCLLFSSENAALYLHGCIAVYGGLILSN